MAELTKATGKQLYEEREEESRLHEATAQEEAARQQAQLEAAQEQLETERAAARAAEQALEAERALRAVDLQAEFEPLTRLMKEVLGDETEKVQVGGHMADLPCILTTSDDRCPADRVPKKTMEINPKHTIMVELKNKAAADKSDKTVPDLIWLSFLASLFISGLSLDLFWLAAGRIHRMIKLGPYIEDGMEGLGPSTRSVGVHAAGPKRASTGVQVGAACKSTGESNQFTNTDENLTMPKTPNEGKPKDKSEGGDEARPSQVTTTDKEGPSDTEGTLTEADIEKLCNEIANHVRAGNPDPEYIAIQIIRLPEKMQAQLDEGLARR